MIADLDHLAEVFDTTLLLTPKVENSLINLADA